MARRVVLEPHDYGHVLHADASRLIAGADHNRRLMREARSRRRSLMALLKRRATRSRHIASRTLYMPVLERQSHRYAV